MTYKGHVENGVVVLEEPAALPEGTMVEVVALGAPPSAEEPEARSFSDRVKHLVGAFGDLPRDFGANHDHYIHGTEKRNE